MEGPSQSSSLREGSPWKVLWQAVACDKPCMLAGRSLLLPEEADRSDSAVLCPPHRFFFFLCLLLLLLLHHGLKGFLEQGVFGSHVHGLASLVKVAAQDALLNIWKSVAVIRRAVYICVWSCTASVVKKSGPG